MKNGMTEEKFNALFGDFMLDGLDTTGTYIPLRMSASTGINVSIRPRVLRLSKESVMFGGTLRVGYTIDEGKAVKSNVVDLNPKLSEQRLIDFCKGFSWGKVSEQRASTLIGVAFAATPDDGDKAIEALENNQVAKEFINHLESTYEEHNDVGFDTTKPKAIAALEAAWLLQTQAVFTVEADKVISNQSAALNKAQDTYGVNVIAFDKKVKEWAEASKDTPSPE